MNKQTSQVVGFLDFLGRVSETSMTIFFWMTIFSLFRLTDWISQGIYHFFGGEGSVRFSTLLLMTVYSLVAIVVVRVTQEVIKSSCET